MGKEFPFSIVDVAGLVPIANQRMKAQSIDADCPFCFKKRKFNMNFVSNVYRCNYCGAKGGMLDLYMQFHPELIGRSEAYHAIQQALGNDSDHGWTQPRQRPRPAPKIPQSKLAMPWELHKTYTTLFSLLSLSPKHKQDLLRRGLTDEQIGRYGYKSTPAYGYTGLVDQVIERGCTVAGVPGFYQDDAGRWTVRFHPKSSGIIIPVLSTAGQIQGAQIRLDHPMEKCKYIWLSSAEKPMGTGSGSPVHFAGSTGVRTICVTEGGLKGTVAHCLTGRTFACLAGAGQYANFARYIPYLKGCGVEEVAVAYDMDLLTNNKVAEWCLALLCSVRDAGLKAKIMKWDPVNKGVDDHYWAQALKKRLPDKLERELQNRGADPAEAAARGRFCAGIRQNGICSKTLAFLYFQELPLGYLFKKAAESPDACFMELMAAVERDIPKDF